MGGLVDSFAFGTNIGNKNECDEKFTAHFDPSHIFLFAFSTFSLLLFLVFVFALISSLINV